MSLRCVCVIVTLFGTTFLNAQNTAKDRCGVQVSKNQYPWLVAIEYEYTNDRIIKIGCTGALISVKHCITKVKCIDSYDRTAKSVLLGLYNNITGGICDEESNGNNCSDKNAIRVPVEKFIAHPNYYKLRVGSFETATNDIALVRLRDTISYTDAIRPICLISTDIKEIAATDQELYVIGLDDQHANKKIHIATAYLDKMKCVVLRFDRVVPEDLICAKDTENNTDACLMTGGLLMNKREDKYELVGLLDIGSSCQAAKRFSNLFINLDWIRGEIPEWTPCGRRKVEHVELIINGDFTKAGDWPWHAAIHRLEKSKMAYICGGTLITKTVVLTAAHCATISGVSVSPEILTVTLGKYFLIGVNLETQEKEVQSVIVHENFAPRSHLDNDIALLVLRSAAIYNDYVQPACVWSNEANDRLPSYKFMGTVVGWGIDQSDALSSQLKQSNMPKVPDTICIRKNPLFYSSVLDNNKKFCAGWANGTSTCNGDSGGGFLMFVPLSAKADSSNAIGSWYVRGIVSLSAAVRNKARCDPYQFVVFTDVAKYIDWIQIHLDEIDN